MVPGTNRPWSEGLEAERPRDAADVRVASNATASADAPQCGQNRLPSGTVREQDVQVIAAEHTRVVIPVGQLAARLLTREQPVYFQREVAAPMVSTGRNEHERLPCSLELGRRSHGQQGPQIGNVLWTRHVITRQDLQGDQVAGPGDAHPQLRQKVDRLGIGHHLRFDPRRREQEIDNRSLRLTGGNESDRGKPPDGLLLDSSSDAVAMGTQVVDQGFGLGIGGQRNNQIRVSRKPRFSSNGDGQTSDERERNPGLSELRADLTKGGLE